MGYRSDVLIVLKDEVEMNRDVKAAFFDDCGFRIVGKREGCTLYIRNQIKWYVDHAAYPHVSIVYGFLRELPRENYRFLLIGDAYSDIEEEGELNDPFHSCIVREFDYDLSECEDEPDRSEEFGDEVPLGKTDCF
jgi:hypothetical protein